MKVYVLVETQFSDNGNICTMVRSVNPSFVKAQEHYRTVKSNFVRTGNHDAFEVQQDRCFRVRSKYSDITTIDQIQEVQFDA